MRKAVWTAIEIWFTIPGSSMSTNNIKAITEVLAYKYSDYSLVKNPLGLRRV
jgi:hypothetical protein